MIYPNDGLLGMMRRMLRIRTRNEEIMDEVIRNERTSKSTGNYTDMTRQYTRSSATLYAFAFPYKTLGFIGPDT